MKLITYRNAEQIPEHLVYTSSEKPHTEGRGLTSVISQPDISKTKSGHSLA